MKCQPLTAVWLDWGFRLPIAIGIKAGLVFGNFVFNRKIYLNLVPNLAKRHSKIKSKFLS